MNRIAHWVRKVFREKNTQKSWITLTSWKSKQVKSPQLTKCPPFGKRT